MKTEEIHDRAEYRALRQRICDNAEKLRKLRQETTALQRSLKEHNRQIASNFDPYHDKPTTSEVIYQSESFSIIDNKAYLTIKCHPKQVPWKAKILDYQYKPEITLLIYNRLSENLSYLVADISAEECRDAHFRTRYPFCIKDAVIDIKETQTVYACEHLVKNPDSAEFCELPDKINIEHFCYLIYIHWLCANIAYQLKTQSDNRVDDIAIKSIEKRDGCITFNAEAITYNSQPFSSRHAFAMSFDEHMQLIVETKTVITPAIRW